MKNIFTREFSNSLTDSSLHYWLSISPTPPAHHSPFLLSVLEPSGPFSLGDFADTSAVSCKGNCNQTLPEVFLSQSWRLSYSALIRVRDWQGRQHWGSPSTARVGAPPVRRRWGVRAPSRGPSHPAWRPSGRPGRSRPRRSEYWESSRLQPPRQGTSRPTWWADLVEPPAGASERGPPLRTRTDWSSFQTSGPETRTELRQEWLRFQKYSLQRFIRIFVILQLSVTYPRTLFFCHKKFSRFIFAWIINLQLQRERSLVQDWLLIIFTICGSRTEEKPRARLLENAAKFTTMTGRNCLGVKIRNAKNDQTVYSLIPDTSGPQSKSLHCTE